MIRDRLMDLAYALSFLFLIQSIATLVESVYVLQLLHTSLDARAASVLVLLAPLLLFLIRRETSSGALWAAALLFVLARSAIPFLGTAGRLGASGVATAAGLLLLPLMLARQPSAPGAGLYVARGLALAVGLSVLLRTLGITFDLSLTLGGGWIAWALGAGLLGLLTQFRGPGRVPTQAGAGGLLWPSVGLMMALALVYFAFSAPAVIARWTQGDYRLIVAAVSLLWLGGALFLVWRPNLLQRLTAGGLGLWNILFMAALVGTILVHTVRFPASPGASPVVVEGPTPLQRMLLTLMLALSPVILANVAALGGRMAGVADPRRLAGGFALGGFLLLLLIFANIFTNVWGYVAPVSTAFRNLFWLPFLIAAAFMAGTALMAWRPSAVAALIQSGLVWRLAYALLVGVLFMATLAAAWRTGRADAVPRNADDLIVMTYNIQQGMDADGEQAHARQLALMRLVNADIIGLQESDSARISLGNVDLLRYYAHHLGYHHYYGPKTVTGTFGTAILSRYPLRNARAVFTYSDKDEIGTAECQVVVDGATYRIYNVHPDGSMATKQDCVNAVITRSAGQERVIALGDYNLREGDPPYEDMDALFQNAWTTVHPTGIDEDGLDMSGRKRIDHIFVSPDLRVLSATYLPSPQSATDHPAHWATLAR